MRELRLELQPHARLGRRRADGQPLAEKIADRPVWEGLRVGDRPALDEANAVAVAPPHPPEEPALTDPGLPRDRNDRPPPLGEPVHDALEHGDLEIAADEGPGRLHRLRLG